MSGLYYTLSVSKAIVYYTDMNGPSETSVCDSREGDPSKTSLDTTADAPPGN